MRLRTFGLVCSVMLSVFVVGCGGGSGGSKTPPTTLTITTTSPLTPGTVGVAYSATVAASGGTAPYTWSVSSGSLPAGLSLSSAGALTGTPTAAASSNFSLSVSDSGSPAQTATLAATLVIAAAPPATLVITTTSPLTPGTVGVTYSATLAASGGTVPYSWTVTTGTLPAGLTLSSAGALTGTPTVSGTYNFTITATDGATPPQTATLAATLVIAAAPALAITTTSLPAGTMGVAYPATTLVAVGGTPPYTWTAGAVVPLPEGLTLSSAGILSGTPTGVSGTSPDFTVTDSLGATVTVNLSLIVNPAPATIAASSYAFYFAGTGPQGTSAAAPAIALVGEFTVQAGTGTVLSGFFDANSNTAAAITEVPITGGTLSLGTDGLSQLTITSAGGTEAFALAVPASAVPGSDSPIRVIGFTDTTGAGSRGSGVLKPIATSSAAIAGNFAFLFSGTDVNGREQALAGSFQTDGAGTITGGHGNSNEVGTLKDFPHVPGTYSVDANGRGTLQIHLADVPYNFSFYQVSPAEWFVMSTDAVNINAPLVTGSVLQQTGPFSTASLPAQSVLEISGLADASGGGVTPDITIGLAASDGAGNVTYTFDEYNGTLATGQNFVVPYAVDPVTGRAETTGSGNQPILYLINSTSAFVLGPDISTSSGILEQQTGTAFTNASFSGNYLGGTSPLPTGGLLNEAGIVAADGQGNILLTTNRSSSEGLVLYQNLSGTYAVDSTGRVVVTTPDNLTRIFYIVSPTKVAYLTSDGGGYLGSFVQ